MKRGVIGAVAGLATGAAVRWCTGRPELSVSTGVLVSITIWFWAWGRISRPGPQRYGRPRG